MDGWRDRISVSRLDISIAVLMHDKSLFAMRCYASAALAVIQCLSVCVYFCSNGNGERRWRNVYDKKPEYYAKDNKTVHLTAHSDKCVAYVTNSKRLYSTFCTVDANY